MNAVPTNLRDDFAQRVVSHTADATWVPSPRILAM